MANADYDTKSATARTVASDIVDAKLNNRLRITNPSSRINSATNLIAGSILASTPEQMATHQWYKTAMTILENIKGTISDDAEWNYQVPVQKQRSFPVSPTNNQTWEEIDF